MKKTTIEPGSPGAERLARSLGKPAATARASWPDEVRALIAATPTFAEFSQRLFGRKLDPLRDESGAFENWTDSNTLDLVSEHTLSTTVASCRPEFGQLAVELIAAYRRLDLDPEALVEFVFNQPWFKAHPDRATVVRALSRSFPKNPALVTWRRVTSRPAGKPFTMSDIYPDSPPHSFADTTQLTFGRNLDGPLPQELWSLKKLIGLEFQHCPVVLLPPELKRLRKLRYLHFEGCDRLELPDNLGELPELERIIIQKTGVERLPESLGDLPRLETLSLWDNPKLTSLPTSLSRMKRLQILSVSGNKRLPVSEVAALRKALPKTTIYTD